MKEYVKCLYYENACFDNPIVTVRDGQDRKHLTLEEVVGLLNTLHQENQQLKHYKLYEDNKRLQTIIADLKEENEQLRKQIQNYEQLFSNSYVGEEETLDGFVGKYVIWENELQKYRKKNTKH